MKGIVNQNNSSRIIYSSKKWDTGRVWIDGKRIYCVTLESTIPSGGNVLHLVGIKGVDNFIEANGTVGSAYGGTFALPFMLDSTDDARHYRCNVQLKKCKDDPNLASENEYVQVLEKETYTYGAQTQTDEQRKKKEIEPGQYQVTNDFFGGDPASGHTKVFRYSSYTDNDCRVTVYYGSYVRGQKLILNVYFTEI